MIVLVTVVSERARTERVGLSGLPDRLGSSAVPAEEELAQGGGRLLALDERGRLRGQINLPSPAGMAWPEATGPLWVLSRRGDALLEVEPRAGAVSRRIEAPSLNDPHTVVPSAQGFLISSTGVDALVELDARGETRWRWWAAEHGFRVGADGVERAVDPAQAQRGRRIPTLERALHLNCAVEDGERVLATAFHSGEILEIRRNGKFKVLRSGLEHPSSLSPHPMGGWICCEASAGRVLHLRGARLDDVEVLAEGLRWVQAAVMAEGRIWVLDNPVHGKQAEAGSRVMMVEPFSGKIDLIRQLSVEWKLQGILPVDATRAGRLGWVRPG